MKKVVGLLLSLALIFTFAACSTSELEAESKKLSTYTISMELNEVDMRITGTQKLDYVNNEEVPLLELCFHLYPNAYREGALITPFNSVTRETAFPNGASYGNIDIEFVKIGGDNIAFTIGGEDSNILVVPLSKELFPGQKLTVEMSYTIQMPNALHRFGFGDNYVNLGNWYPILCVFENGEYNMAPYYSNGDPFYSDTANYEVSISVPEAFKGAFTGVVNEQNTVGGNTTYNCSAKVVRDFAAVLSKEFKIISENVGEVMVSYYYYDDENAIGSHTIAKESLLTFNELFGAYPYSTLSVVQTGFVHGGMEYPNLVMISDSLKEKGNLETIVHEIAHQWWYGVVGNDQINAAWLDEGLTSYSTVLFFEKNPQYNISRQQMIASTQNVYSQFISLYEKVVGKKDMSMDRPINKYLTEGEYVYLTYAKGELMFDSIRTSLGMEKFCKALQAYYTNNKYKHADMASLIYAFEKTSGTKLESFITSWIDGTAII